VTSDATSRPSGSAIFRCSHSLPRWWRHASCRPLKKRLGPPSSSTSGLGVLPLVRVARFWYTTASKRLAMISSTGTPVFTRLLASVSAKMPHLLLTLCRLMPA
jgi:hypothetical protein